MNSDPNFIIIGAMKCATSSLHVQLAAQPGIFMCEPKEPNFFSNDEEYAKGIEWYKSLFAEASVNDLCGESSTHYTKLPTYPYTIERLKAHLPDVKLIYVMRHPIDRLKSQYIHEWSQTVISVDINRAIDQYPELISYSKYSLQLQPYFEAFGRERVLPVFFERVLKFPQAELERICQFIGYPGQPVWNTDVESHTQNAGGDRWRKTKLRMFITENPVLKTIRQNLIPKSLRNKIRNSWAIQKKPEIEPEKLEYLQNIFDEDLAVVGSWLGIELSCDNYKAKVQENSINWVDVMTKK